MGKLFQRANAARGLFHTCSVPFLLLETVSAGVLGREHKKTCISDGATQNREAVCPWDIPGDPMFKTLHFHCRGHGLNPWRN